MDVDVNDSVNLDGYHKFECSMENSFKTILSMMKEKNGGDLLDFSRLALRVITNSPLKYHKVNSELDHNCLDSDFKRFHFHQQNCYANTTGGPMEKYTFRNSVRTHCL